VRVAEFSGKRGTLGQLYTKNESNMEEMMLNSEKKEESTLVQSLRDKIAELDTILALMPGHVYWMNREGFYLGCNNAVSNFLKLNSREEIVGTYFGDSIPSDDADVVGKNNFHVMESGTTYIGEEVCEIPGHEGIYLSQKVPFKNKDGKIIGLLGISLDITEQKRVESELKVAKEIAEIANQTKTEFIRNMEHDIRTPLSGIMSVITYLNASEQDTKKKGFLNELEKSTKELLNYLDNIVEFSQTNTESIPLIAKEFNLEHMLKSILSMESAAAKHKALDLILSYPESIPKYIISDRFRLHRILLNLVNNSIKFTHKGYVKIHVACLEINHDSIATIEITIEDTGIGIDKKYHQMIYDKFVRCDPSNQGLYKGTGLGLWIVHHFLEDLNGRITLESEIGKGSKFICVFPFQVSDRSD
jgi:signal transduction histidine kinase